MQSLALRVCLLLLGFLLIGGLAAGAQQATSQSSLSLEQESLKNRFERLEAVATRLAELAAASEPERAEQLRRAITASREQGVAERFETIVDLLKQEQVSAAARDQEQLRAQLEALLQVLLEDPNSTERDAMRKFLKEQLREIGKIIREQRSLHGETIEAESDLQKLGEDQERLADKAQQLKGKLDQQPRDAIPNEASEGSQNATPAEESQPGETPPGETQPGESQPGGSPSGESQAESPPTDQSPQQPSTDPMQRAADRVEAARKAMRQAEEELRQAQRENAAERQQQAQRDLEAARAELERILRQLREEEMEQLLTRLAARFREMLAQQRAIYDETVAIHQGMAQGGDRTALLQAIRLSRREAELVREAEKALVLLREDGTSVAFPETASQIAADMQSVTTRLASGDVEAITQTIELDVIAGLEDMIAAFDQARDEIAQQQGQPQPQSAAGGQPGESPLVSRLAELRMIRTLQARIYRRTQVIGEMVQQSTAPADQVARELETLANRQNKVFQATRDLESEANR